ncbi:MAG: serine/threonine protein kinase [Gemmataceae bacterium]|nr:serine/threonine protein kinase [Gemmataceae bacterium]
MGVVYLARQTALNRPVALKMILGVGRASALDLARFLAEAETAAAIDHPHVVRVYDFGQHAGRPYLAMEYLPRGTLADRVRAGRLPARSAAELVERIARGVSAAHSQGVVHRDLKPGNILFDDQGGPKVADFGLAKQGQSDLTQTQVVMGTPAYMAPEQAGGRSKFAGPQADVWALGVILYECLTGTRPFEAENTGELLARVRTAVPEVPRDLDLSTKVVSGTQSLE